MEATEQRVFTPGDGATPPALTGREREEAVLTQCLADPDDIPTRDGSTRNLRAELTARCRRKPLAVLLDEAHVRIDADALNAIVRDSQRYPYFIQLWGEALWQQRLATGATRLTAAHADAARPDVAVRITDYYQDRYYELDQSGWLAAAEQVAARLQCMPTLTYAELKSAIADGLAPNADHEPVQAALATLQRLGFVWCPPGQQPPVRYEAGIPSLMTHVLDQTPATPAPTEH